MITTTTSVAEAAIATVRFFVMGRQTRGRRAPRMTTGFFPKKIGAAFSRGLRLEIGLSC
jgi:hypothetical protein